MTEIKENTQFEQQQNEGTTPESEAQELDNKGTNPLVAGGVAGGLLAGGFFIKKMMDKHKAKKEAAAANAGNGGNKPEGDKPAPKKKGFIERLANKHGYVKEVEVKPETPADNSADKGGKKAD